MKIREILFRTILNDGYEYDNRYEFIGKLEDLENYGFKKLSNGDKIKEIKVIVGKDDIIYYKTSGLGYFIIYKNYEEIVFMSGVPVWWIGDEEKTNYYDDLDVLLKNNIIAKNKIGDDK